MDELIWQLPLKSFQSFGDAQQHLLQGLKIIPA